MQTDHQIEVNNLKSIMKPLFSLKKMNGSHSFSPLYRVMPGINHIHLYYMDQNYGCYSIVHSYVHRVLCIFG